MIPRKLKSGDHIRIIAPSKSFAILTKRGIVDVAEKRLSSLGLEVSYGDHIMESDGLASSSVESRVSDLNDAFRDKNIDGILTAIGGFNSNQILRQIDYKTIKANPKIFCGYSDITALSNAIFAKTGMVTYSGPHFSSFGMQKGFEDTLKSFKECLFTDKPYDIKTSVEWSNDKWYLDQKNRKFLKNKGPIVISKGEAEGRIIGGNLCTLSLLQGTEFMPNLKDSILFIEDDYETREVVFDRMLQSLLQQPEAEGIKGVVIGRFEKASEISDSAIKRMIKTKKELEGIPVAANVDFGHTTPMITFPIGGKAEIVLTKDNVRIKITEH